MDARYVAGRWSKLDVISSMGGVGTLLLTYILIGFSHVMSYIRPYALEGKTIPSRASRPLINDPEIRNHGTVEINLRVTIIFHKGFLPFV